MIVAPGQGAQTPGFLSPWLELPSFEDRLTWLSAVAGLDLVEYAFTASLTPDQFLIRESRFVDLASGTHYAEKQILPLWLAARTEAKRSHAGRVLRGAPRQPVPGLPAASPRPRSRRSASRPEPRREPGR